MHTDPYPKGVPHLQYYPIGILPYPIPPNTPYLRYIISYPVYTSYPLYVPDIPIYDRVGGARKIGGRAAYR